MPTDVRSIIAAIESGQFDRWLQLIGATVLWRERTVRNER